MKICGTIGAAAVLALALASPAAAKVFHVTTRADHKPGKCTNGDCTLREAVIAANERAGADVVRLPRASSPYRLTRKGADEELARKGDVDLRNDELEIQGASPAKSVIEQTRRDRVLDVPGSDADVSLKSLTLTGGRVDSTGGGIRTNSPLDLDGVVVRGNRADGSGGGIDVNRGPFVDTGQLTVRRSTVRDNEARVGGGGIAINQSVLTQTISNSTLSGNSASSGGGLAYGGSGQATILNSTISGNEAVPGDAANPRSTGGGLSVYGDVTVVYSTIARNRAPAVTDVSEPRAASIYAYPGGEANLENAIVADPLGSAPSCDGAVVSHGHNLDSGTSCGFDEGTDSEGADAGLKLLGRNGGPTSTHALRASSDAIDAGACNPLLIPVAVIADQRGIQRPQGPGCDLGAYERVP